MVPIISVVGSSKENKTKVTEKLIEHLSKRGYNIAAIKRDVHRHDLDTPGKTSWRHTRAGAQTAMVSSASRITLFKQVKEEWTLDDLTDYFLSDADIVIADGFSDEVEPKIKVLTAETEKNTQKTNSNVFAFVDMECNKKSNQKDIPEYNFKEIEKLAILIENKFLKKS